MEYYHVFAATMDPCSLDRAGLDPGQAEWCPECRALLSCSGPLAVRIQGRRLSRSPLNMIYGYPDIGLIREDVLAAIPSDAAVGSLVIGPLLGDDGKPIRRWFCFYSRHRLTVRGTDHVALRYCQGCGHPHYFALGDLHLCPPPPSGISLFHAGYCSLVVDTRVFFRLSPVIGGRLRCQKLPIFAAARDGLGNEIAQQPKLT